MRRVLRALRKSVPRPPRPVLHRAFVALPATLLMALVAACIDPKRSAIPGADRVGGLRLFTPGGPPQHLVLLLSGDGGWSRGLDGIAAGLGIDGALVAGIDSRVWLSHLRREPGSCLAAGRELADLGRELAQRHGLIVPPVLIGHSAGATLAVIALAQAPRGSFRGALTLAFCPELDLPLPVCPSAAVRSSGTHHGQRLRAAGALPAPWIDLHGLADAECPAGPAREFAAQVPNAQFLPLPGVGHTYGAAGRWWPQFRAAFSALVRTDPAPAVAARAPLP